MTAHGNSVEVAGYAGGYDGVADRQKQMRAYDALPPAVQRALDDALFEISVIATLEFHKEHGTEKTLAEIDDSNRCHMRAIGADECSSPPTNSSSPRTKTERSASASRCRARTNSRIARLVPTILTVVAS